MYHQFYPGSVHGLGSTSIYTDFILPAEYALEHSLYISDDYKVTEKFSIKYGLTVCNVSEYWSGNNYTYDNEL